MDNAKSDMSSLFWRCSTLTRIVVIFSVVMCSAELLVLAYYRNHGAERIQSELILSGCITAIVSLPVIIYVMLQTDTLRSLTERLAHLSETDQMTGLLNRQTFLDRLELGLSDPVLGRRGGVFAYVDADHFKRLNDRFGHVLGDKVIQLLAEHIRAATREGDLCARLGGEEFGIFLAGASLDEAAEIAERLRRDVSESERALGIPGITLSVSIGLAAHRPGEAAMATMQAADLCLYAAKREGRNTVVIERQRYRAA
jgi:diguanylate cyclase